VWTKCWRTGPRKERREKRRRRRKGRKGAKTDQIEMNESALGHVNGSDPDLGTEEGGTGAEGGETGAETVEVEEKRVGKRGREAEIETGEGGAEARRGQGIDLEKGGAAGVATGVDDLEVQPAVVACRPLNQDINRSMCRLVAGELICGFSNSNTLCPSGPFWSPAQPLL